MGVQPLGGGELVEIEVDHRAEGAMTQSLDRVGDSVEKVLSDAAVDDRESGAVRPAVTILTSVLPWQVLNAWLQSRTAQDESTGDALDPSSIVTDVLVLLAVITTGVGPGVH